ncbi:MAG: porin [Ignavibacteria bacterium]|nr:porin [Ignavibacteria bacterium]
MENRFNIFSALTVIVILSAVINSNLKSQTESDFKFSGYTDTYYAYDNDKNGNSLRQFSALAPVRDEFRINTAQITGRYTSDKIRGIVTLQFGDIPKYNWPQSPNEYLQFIQEANAGFRAADKLWIDFGYFLTHIGAEGVVPKNNFLTSMSLATYFEPFFQSGVKMSYDFSDKVYGSLYLLNGYNVFADNNKNKSAGLQLGVKPANNLEMIYNNIIGNEQPAGSIGKTRFYNNLVFKLAATKDLDILFGADFAMQDKSDLIDSAASANMFAGLIALKYKITPKFSAMARGEIYEDKNGILSGFYVNTNFDVTGLYASGITLGMEYKPIDNGYVRFESRYLTSNKNLKIFSDGSNARNSRTEFIFTTSVEF